MRILIAADMEGITGVTNWDHVMPENPEYARFRRLMTGDINAAIQGAFDAGANEVIVTDGHHKGTNVLIEELDPRARLNTGNVSPFSMVQGVDSSVNGVFFVGYHARAGTPDAILDHTWSSRCVANLWLNDLLVGETGLTAAVCGHFGVPVLMVSGDQAVGREALDLLGKIEVAAIKHATGRMSAECLPPQVSQTKICEAAARAVSRLKTGDAPPPLRLPAPVQVTIEFKSTEMAEQASILPGTHRPEGRRLEFSAGDMLTAYRLIRAAIVIAKAS